MKAKANISRARTEIFWQRDVPSLPVQCQATVLGLKEKGWKFYIVDQVRGRCYGTAKTITIPDWVVDKTKTKPGYMVWYLMHECAHATDLIRNGKFNDHGPIFMEILKELCPKEFVHYEVGYKPRNATAAGIGVSPADFEV